VLLPGSSPMPSAFPKRRFGRLLASFRERDFPQACYRGCSYFFMFRPHSLHASQIAPTAASKPAGQPRLLHPSRTCVVTFARIGYAIRPTTGNWRNEDFHLARFAALSAAHSLFKLFGSYDPKWRAISPPPTEKPTEARSRNAHRCWPCWRWRATSAFDPG
jgi:hypothetical protein